MKLLLINFSIGLLLLGGLIIAPRPQHEGAKHTAEPVHLSESVSTIQSEGSTLIDDITRIEEEDHEDAAPLEWQPGRFAETMVVEEVAPSKSPQDLADAAVSSLSDLLTSPDGDKLADAFELIEELGADAIPSLSNALRDAESPDVLYTLVFLLAEIGTSDSGRAIAAHGRRLEPNDLRKALRFGLTGPEPSYEMIKVLPSIPESHIEAFQQGIGPNLDMEGLVLLLEGSDRFHGSMRSRYLDILQYSKYGSLQKHLPELVLESVALEGEQAGAILNAATNFGSAEVVDSILSALEMSGVGEEELDHPLVQALGKIQNSAGIEHMVERWMEDDRVPPAARYAIAERIAAGEAEKPDGAN